MIWDLYDDANCKDPKHPNEVGYFTLYTHTKLIILLVKRQPKTNINMADWKTLNIELEH